MWYEGNIEHFREVSDETREFFEANENLTLENLSRNVTKSFLCYPKDIPGRF